MGFNAALKGLINLCHEILAVVAFVTCELSALLDDVSVTQVA